MELSCRISCVCCSPSLRPGTEPAAHVGKDRGQEGWAVPLQGAGRRSLLVTRVETGLGWDERPDSHRRAPSPRARPISCWQITSRHIHTRLCLICSHARTHAHTCSHMHAHARTRSHSHAHANAPSGGEEQNFDQPSRRCVQGRTEITASLMQSRMKMSLTCQKGPGVGAGVTGGRRKRAARVWGSEGRGGRRKLAVRPVCRALCVLAPTSADAGGGVAIAQGDLRDYV